VDFLAVYIKEAHAADSWPLGPVSRLGLSPLPSKIDHPWSLLGDRNPSVLPGLGGNPPPAERGRPRRGRPSLASLRPQAL
jgi:hypothetical protein